MSNQQTTSWHSAKHPPNDYCPYLCILRMNDQGECAPWQQVLHYDFKNKVWCENDPSTCMTGEAKELSSWWTVIYWKPLEWPEYLNAYT